MDFLHLPTLLVCVYPKWAPLLVAPGVGPSTLHPLSWL